MLYILQFLILGSRNVLNKTKLIQIGLDKFRDLSKHFAVKGRICVSF